MRRHLVHVTLSFMPKQNLLSIIQYPAWISAGSAHPKAKRIWYEGACKSIGPPRIHHDSVRLLHFLFKFDYAQRLRSRKSPQQGRTVEVVVFHFSKVWRNQHFFAQGSLGKGFFTKLEERISFFLVSKRAEILITNPVTTDAASSVGWINNDVVTQRQQFLMYARVQSLSLVGLSLFAIKVGSSH